MKTIMFIILGLLILFHSCNIFNAKRKGCNKDNDSLIVYFDDKGDTTLLMYLNDSLKRNGVYVEFYEDGTRKLQHSYCNGVLNGQSLFYYQNGEIWKKYNYKKNEIEGKYLEFYDNGQIKMCSYYQKGMKVGYEIEYFISGNISSKGEYCIAPLDSIVIDSTNTAFNENITIDYEIGSDSISIKCGEWIEYYDNNNQSINVIGNYYDGYYLKINFIYNEDYENWSMYTEIHEIKDGKWTFFDFDGKIYKEVIYNKGVVGSVSSGAE